MLAHRKLNALGDPANPPRLDRPTLEAARRLREKRVEQGPAAAQELGQLIEDFHDPMSPERPGTLAAMEPVMIANRVEEDPELADTGWVVVVEEATGGKDAP